MSKRHGDVRVEDFIVRDDPIYLLFSVPFSLFLLFRNVVGNQEPFWTGSFCRDGASTIMLHKPKRVPLSPVQQLSFRIARGSWTWMRWLTRYNAHHVWNHSVLLTFLLLKFSISALTHRNTILEGAKLEYINKRHLMRQVHQPNGLQTLAEKVHQEIKEVFPHRYDFYWICNKFCVLLITSSLQSIHNNRYDQESHWYSRSVFFLAFMLIALACKTYGCQGRLFNIYDIPIHAPYLFTEPDYTTKVAQSMRSAIPSEDYGMFLILYVQNIPDNHAHHSPHHQERERKTGGIHSALGGSGYTGCSP